MSETTKLSVWVDNDNCTGGGECCAAVPSVFVHKEGICHTKDGKELRSGPEVLVEVPLEHHEKVMDAAQNCPGECIFIEVA